MKSVLFIFIDGLGIGDKDPAINPLAAFEPRVLRLFSEALGPFPRDGVGIRTDPSLGVSGLPQSATGQTTILTGINAASHLGRHLQGFPNAELRDLITQNSLLRRLKEAGFRVTFANTYTPRFFEERPRRLSVSTVMTQAAGVDFWRLEDLLAGRSIFMDFTNRVLQDRGFEVPLRAPGEAAEILVSLAQEYDFCFYEYFLTDLVGHRGTFQQAVELLQSLDQFLAQVVEGLDLQKFSLLVTSDHGNIEQMDRKQHTLNHVPTLIWGELQELVRAREEPLSLTAITPLILEYLLSVKNH